MDNLINPQATFEEKSPLPEGYSFDAEEPQQAQESMKAPLPEGYSFDATQEEKAPLPEGYALEGEEVNGRRPPRRRSPRRA